MMHNSAERSVPMSEDNKNLASDSERTSILPQSELQAADQTEVLPIHAS